MARACIAVLLALCACTGAPAPGEAEFDSTSFEPTLAQPNDVSVMFPPPPDAAALELRLGAASVARGGELLPRAAYEAAFGPPGTLQAGGTPAAPDHARLRVVSFRLDPCFAALGAIDHDACDNQLRVVLQTFELKSGVPLAADNAVHAFYRLTRAELTEAVRTLIDLRLDHGDERLGPLAPHPLAGEPGVERSIQELVAKVAGAENLTRVTLFTQSGLGTAWNFSGFDFDADGARRMTLAQVADGTEVVAFFRGFTPGSLTGNPAFTPPTTAAPADDMQLLGNTGVAKQATPSERQRAFDALVRIENPDLHTPDTIDCASCHAAEPVRRIAGDAFGLSPSDDLAFAADERFVPAADLAATSVDPDVDMHMFSYLGTRASIHRRTIHETAAVVAYLNEHVLGD
jgi:hypothetical protein